MSRQLCAATLGLLLGLFGIAFSGGQAFAHQSSFSYATIALSEDGKVASYEVRLSTRDLFEALQLGEDRDASDAEIAAGAEKLRRYVFERVSLRSDTRGCAFEPGAVRVVHEGERFAQVAGALRCAAPIGRLELDYQLFFDLDPRHEGLLTVDGQLVQLAKPDKTHFAYDTGRGVDGSVSGFLRSGIDHVLFGLDHILFLVALLLVVCLSQEGKELLARTPLQSLRRTAGIVTAFTIGHSITLIIAALGWLELSSRFVESMIAASIVYVAIENVMRPDPPRRYLITFSFGLMHGLGFAAMLRPLLPAQDTVLPLLVFNLGVELGQLIIVACALPVLYGLIRGISVARYRRVALPLGCAALSVFGMIWLAERALEIELIGI